MSTAQAERVKSPLQRQAERYTPYTKGPPKPKLAVQSPREIPGKENARRSYIARETTQRSSDPRESKSSSVHLLA
jgi:hypothetical protein